jgi:hypothetical protein
MDARPQILLDQHSAFCVKALFQSPENNIFLPGMQSQVLQCQGDAAFVQACDLFDTKGVPIKDWISRSVIDMGAQPYGPWAIDACQITRRDRAIWCLLAPLRRTRPKQFERQLLTTCTLDNS